MSKIDILGVKVDKVTMFEAIARIEAMISEGGKHQVVTPNPEFMMLAQKDKEFKEILYRADLAIPDGVGLLAAAKYLSMRSTSIPILREFQKIAQGFWVGFSVLLNRRSLDVITEQVAGVDLVFNLAEIAAEKAYSFYLLGGGKEVAQKVRKTLEESFAPGLRVVGAEGGGLVSVHSNEGKVHDQKIVDRINKANPDILLVAFGAPKQEKWIAHNLPQLNVKVAIGVGGTFDFIIESPPRAPKLLRRRGLEWLCRLIKQPWRLRRILDAFPMFPLMVAWQRLK